MSDNDAFNKRKLMTTDIAGLVASQKTLEKATQPAKPRHFSSTTIEQEFAEDVNVPHNVEEKITLLLESIDKNQDTPVSNSFRKSIKSFNPQQLRKSITQAISEKTSRKSSIVKSISSGVPEVAGTKPGNSLAKEEKDEHCTVSPSTKSESLKKSEPTTGKKPETAQKAQTTGPENTITPTLTPDLTPTISRKDGYLKVSNNDYVQSKTPETEQKTQITNFVGPEDSITPTLTPDLTPTVSRRVGYLKIPNNDYIQSPLSTPFVPVTLTDSENLFSELVLLAVADESPVESPIEGSEGDVETASTKSDCSKKSDRSKRRVRLNEEGPMIPPMNTKPERAKKIIYKEVDEKDVQN